MPDKFFVYALVSDIHQRIYVGFSSNLEKRIMEHNSGKTKSYRPWVLLYSEVVLGRINARNSEKSFNYGVAK